MRPDYAREVRSVLTDPHALCGAIGWLERSKRQSRGVLIRCPKHGEKNPSCSVTTGPDGTVRVRCFGCDWSGDALEMVALAFGLSTRTQFREVLAIGAELGGHHGLASEIRDGAPSERRQPVPRPAAQPEPEYPDETSVAALWGACSPVDTDGLAVRVLRARGIDHEVLAGLGLARVIGFGFDRSLLPGWARYGSRSWVETGHTMIVPAFDSTGKMRSVRAWRTTEDDATPKRLPPKGHRASELVQANRPALMMLRRAYCPATLAIVEGEPDFITAATNPRLFVADAVIGIGSGSWTEDFARRVPSRTRVIVSTHADEAGDRYADHILETLGDRCPASRWRPAA